MTIGTEVLGTDVSANQGANLDWPSISASGVRFAICKSTEAQGYVDRTFSRNVSCARAAGIATGSYHFFSPARDPEEQAKLYHSVAAGAVDLPPVIDFESLRGATPTDAAARALAFVIATEQMWGQRCIVYTYPSFAEQIGPALLAPFADRPLWIANYGVSAPKVPAPWTSWACWQFDGNGGRRFPDGTDADFSWLAMAVADLIKRCDLHNATTEPAPPPADETPTDPGTPTALHSAASTIADEIHDLADAASKESA